MLFSRFRTRKFEKKIKPFLEITETTDDREKQLDEFIILLEKENFSSDDVIAYQHRPVSEKLKPFRGIDILEGNREEQLDQFILLLEQENITSEEVYSYHRRLRIIKVISLCIGLTLMAFGAIIILLPLPKYLEIKTIFYFNPDDGITISDIFAIFLILIGSYITARIVTLRKT